MKIDFTSPKPWRIGCAIGLGLTIGCLVTDHPVFAVLFALIAGPMALISLAESLP